jgi:hypothetical protein
MSNAITALSITLVAAALLCAPCHLKQSLTISSGVIVDMARANEPSHTSLRIPIARFLRLFLAEPDLEPELERLAALDCEYKK